MLRNWSSRPLFPVSCARWERSTRRSPLVRNNPAPLARSSFVLINRPLPPVIVARASREIGSRVSTDIVLIWLFIGVAIPIEHPACRQKQRRNLAHDDNSRTRRVTGPPVTL